MRGAFTTLIASVVLAGGLSLAAPQPAAADGYRHHGYGHRYEYGYDRGRYDHGCRCYRGRELGYWERPTDRHRRWNRHHHKRYRQPPVHYYPGYGYYPGTSHGYGGHHGYRGQHGHGGHHGYGGHGYGGHHGGGYGYDHRDRSRSAWCASHYRSYDWRSGTYVTYDGRRVYCG